MFLLTIYAHWRVQNDTRSATRIPTCCQLSVGVGSSDELSTTPLPQWPPVGSSRKRESAWKPALPSSERSQEMHDSWQLCAGIGGGMCTERTQSLALFTQDGLRRPKVPANTNSENHSCSGSQSWENKSLLNFWLYMALVYSTSQLPWGWKGLSWPLFLTLFELRPLKIKPEVKQKPGHNLLPQWSILFSLEVSTCLPTSSLQLGGNGICLAWVLTVSTKVAISVIWGDEFSTRLISGYAQWRKGELAADNKRYSSCCKASALYYP